MTDYICVAEIGILEDICEEEIYEALHKAGFKTVFIQDGTEEGSVFIIKSLEEGEI